MQKVDLSEGAQRVLELLEHDLHTELAGVARPF
jgi:hypothetical protein